MVHIKRFQFTQWSRDKLSTLVRLELGRGYEQRRGFCASRAGSQLPTYVCRLCAIASLAQVSFPTRGLDMSPFLSHPEDLGRGSALYDLFGVSNHMGALGGGHYTASCLHRATTGAASLGGTGDGVLEWRTFNDANVTPLRNEHELQSPVAYVLFYRRRA